MTDTSQFSNNDSAKDVSGRIKSTPVRRQSTSSVRFTKRPGKLQYKRPEYAAKYRVVDLEDMQVKNYIKIMNQDESVDKDDGAQDDCFTKKLKEDLDQFLSKRPTPNPKNKESSDKMLKLLVNNPEPTVKLTVPESVKREIK